MKEYGSEFNITAKSNGASEKVGIKNVAWLRSGRDSLFLVAKDIIKKNKFNHKIRMLVPNLHCESMILPFYVNGFEINTYSINKQFDINFDSIFNYIQNYDILLITDYYNRKDYTDTYKKLKDKNKNLVIIEDITQILFNFNFDDIDEKIDYVVGSFRKWFGVTNGGVAISNGCNFGLTASQEDNEFTLCREKAFIIKEKYNEITENSTELEKSMKQKYKSEYRDLFAKAESSFNYKEVYACKKEDISIIDSQDRNRINIVRKNNYKKLASELLNIKGISLALDGESESSFMCPIIIENGRRNIVQKDLASYGVYAQVLWPLTTLSAKNIDNDDSFAINFSDNMLALPIDQRYNENDMIEIAKVVQKVLNQQRLIIVGASILQLPAILKAKEMGLYVAVADYNPKAIGVQYADEYFNCSTIDKEGLLDVAKVFKPNGIMTMATDMPMRAIAYVCSKLDLPCITIETSELCTDKLKMIERFKERSIASPWYYCAETQSELIKNSRGHMFPCIMKPVDSSGSRGVVLCNTLDEMIKEYTYAIEHSNSKKVIIEEYMIGNEVSVEIFVENGIAHILQVTDKLTTGSPHFVEMGHSQPSTLQPSVIEEIKNLAKSAVISLGIFNGPAHVEIMATSSGAKIIEIGARMGGDCITSHLVPLSTGIDMTKNTILYALGKPLELNSTIQKSSAIRFLKTNKLGKIKKINGIDNAKNYFGIADVEITKNVGDTITNICSSTDRIGYVISQANTVSDAINICEKAMSMINIEIGE